MSQYETLAKEYFNKGIVDANNNVKRTYAITLPKKYQVFWEAAFDKQTKILQAAANEKAKIWEAKREAEKITNAPLVRARVAELRAKGEYNAAEIVQISAALGVFLV